MSSTFLWPLYFMQGPPRPAYLWHGKLEWILQTPTVVLVLLNLRHCTIEMHRFWFLFLTFYIRNKQHDSVYEIIQNTQRKTHLIEKYLLRWLSCMMEMLQCMISKVQCWIFFVNGLVGSVRKRWRNLLLQFFCTNKVTLTYKLLL